MTRTWLITGAGSGFGKALCKAVIESGERAIGTVRNDDDARRLAEELPGCIPLVGDLAQPNGPRAIVAAALERGASIDVLVNNAGRGFVAAVEEASPDEMRALFDVNFFAAAEMIQAVLPHMRARRSGLIVNVTSISGFKPWSGTGYYCASKFALEGLGQTLAQEVAALGIKVMNVQPGALRTDFNGRSLMMGESILDAYADTAHIARRALIASDGKQHGDPVRAAQAVIAASRTQTPPMNLLLGSDAVAMCRERVARIVSDLEEWSDVSTRIGFGTD